MPTTTRRLLLVGMGTMGQPYVERAHRRGVRCAILDWPNNREKAVPLLRDGDAWYPVSGGGDEPWHSAASAALADGPVDAVIGFAEPHVVPAALVATELGLPGPGLLAAQVSRNKLLQRNILARHGVPQPAFRPAYGADEAADWAAERYPVVLKPVSQQGSVGVRVVAGEDELRDWAAQDSGGGAFLAEEYLAGAEFSCEAMVVGGELAFSNITDKVTTAPPYCVELGHVVPSACPEPMQQAMRELTARVVRAVRMSDGIIHLEMKWENSGPHAVEFAVRTPGDHIFDLIELATGVDMYDSVVAVALGERPRPGVGEGRAAGIWYPEVPAGRVVVVDGLPDSADVVANRLKLHPGAVLGPLRSSNDRAGSVLLVAGDRTALDRRIGVLRDQLRVTVAAVEPA